MPEKFNGHVEQDKLSIKQTSAPVITQLHACLKFGNLLWDVAVTQTMILVTKAECTQVCSVSGVTMIAITSTIILDIPLIRQVRNTIQILQA